MVLVVANDTKSNLIGLLLLLGRAIPGYKAESHVLRAVRSTSPCMPTKLLGFSFSSSIICYLKYHKPIKFHKLNGRLPQQLPSKSSLLLPPAASSLLLLIGFTCARQLAPARSLPCRWSILHLFVFLSERGEELLNRKGVTLMPLPSLALVSLNMAPIDSAYCFTSL